MNGLRTDRPGRRVGRIKLVILLVAGAVLGGGVTFAVVGRGAKASSAHEKPGKEAKGKEKGKGKEAEEEKPVEPICMEMGAFLVNLTCAGSLRYLRAEVTLGIAGMEPPKEAKAKGGHGGEGGDAKPPTLPPDEDAKTRDAIVRVLSRQSFDDLRLRGPDNKLKQELVKELSSISKTHKVESVLFTSFAMQ